MLIPGPQWTTAYGSILIRTADLLWAAFGCHLVVSSASPLDLALVVIANRRATSKPLAETLLLADGKTQVIISKEVQLSCLVAELFPSDITFQVTDLGLCPIILGLPWLKGANPNIDWQSGNITTRSPPLTPLQRAPSQLSSTSPPASLDIDVIDAIAFNKSLQSDCITWGTLYPSAIQSQQLLATTITSSDTTTALAYDTGLSDIIPPEYHQYLDVFSRVRADKLPPHRTYDHHIPLEEGKSPPFGPIYSLSEHELKTLWEYLEENLAKGFISPSDSPAASPILFVKKKDDLRGAYNLLRIAKGDKWKTAFRTRYGLFQYNVMPFGLTNAPASFQHLMNDTFKDMLDWSLIIYLDDLLIYSSTLKQHQGHVSAVLARLRQAGLYAKAEKCQFSTSQTEFLGFVVSDQGVSMDPRKTEVITNWPVPKSVHDVQVFLGFCNFYRKFIPQYSRTAYPLTQLLHKEAQSAPFAWNNEAQHAFEQLRSAFGTDTILHHFDPTRPIIVETDASDFAVAAVLSQSFDQGTRHPIAFFSKKLDPAQLNYPIFDKEMFAIVAAFKHWCQYLEGVKFQVQVLTDHRSLEYFTTTKQLNRRQARWSELLADFDFVIQYRPGAQAGLPDALTRRSDMRPMDRGLSLMQEHNPDNFQTLLKPHQLRLAATGTLTVKSDITDKIRDALPRDPWTSSLLEQVHLGSSPTGFAINSMNLLTYQDLVVVPDVDDLRLLIVQDRHDSPSAGHPGRRKTLSLVRRSFFWLGMSKFVHTFVDSCETCRRIKAVWHKPYGHLKSLPVPPHPWSSISMDLIEQLPPSSDFTAILVVVDHLTKMAIFVPTTNELDAPELAKLFLRHVYSKHGLPTSIVSDRGSEFTSHFWRSLSTLLGIENHFSSAYHPQSDGQTEHVNQVLEQFLRGYSNHLQTDWSNLLPLAEFSYNNAEHASTQLTPFFTNYGYHPCFSFDNTDSAPLPPFPAARSYADQLKQLHEYVRGELDKANSQSAEQFNKRRLPSPQFQPGNRVWLSAENIRSLCPTKKLDYHRLGPFSISEVISSHAYRLQLPPSMKIHNMFHVDRLEPYVANPIPNRVQPPPPPVEIESDMEYEVEQVLDSKVDHRYSDPLFYLVRWVGYGPDHNSWEPASNLTHASDMIAEFHAANPTRPSLPHR
ncbi:related to transposon-encoded proteins with TYA, reverse transcriptase, integrase domains in various combinations [Ustilago sp. UG-2017b]|nr:related to transposon-encoded proteins with TYA, reverse transcriptase, integrase domains in various combinations [Ustilago sp. UG-2017b]